MDWHLGAGLACGLYGVAAGLLVPAMIARIPEPDPEDPAAEVGEEDVSPLDDETQTPHYIPFWIAPSTGPREPGTRWPVASCWPCGASGPAPRWPCCHCRWALPQPKPIEAWTAKRPGYGWIRYASASRCRCRM